MNFAIQSAHSYIDAIDAGAMELDDESLDAILTEETLTELGQALIRLDDRARALVVLVYYDGKTLKEAASMLNMSCSNSKLVMKKALQELKDFLD